MPEKLTAFLKDLNIKPESNFLLAVSGGMDSMVMADIFMKEGLQFSIAHCNFNLRGNDSDEDQQFVSDYCDSHRIPFLVKSFDTKIHAREHNISIEMAARDLRYEWFHDLMKKGDFDLLCTAHHRNDSLETAVFNLTKGTGISGIRGIKPLNGYILRPLIGMSRRDIASYAKKNDLSWREDKTNKLDTHHRNFIRKHIVPSLEKINPSITDTYALTSERLRGVESLVRKTVEEISKRIVGREDDMVTIDKSGLSGYSMEEAKVILNEILKVYGFVYGQISDIYDSLKGQSGKRFDSGTYTLYSDRERWVLSSNADDNHPVMEYIASESGNIAIGDQHFECSTVDRNDWRMSKDKNIGQLDFSKLVFPLLVRTWRSGDTFSPLGMKGKKKVSDFMIDRKIPITLKRKKLVFLSGDDIVWLSGEQVGEAYKVGEKTDKVFIIKKK